MHNAATDDWPYQVYIMVRNYRRVMLSSSADIQLDDVLVRSAQAKADDMYTRDYYGHNDPDGKGFTELVFREGGAPLCGRLAENIAKGQPGPREVFEAWLKSSDHQANMLGPSWTRVGVGQRGLLWVQHFA